MHSARWLSKYTQDVIIFSEARLESTDLYTRHKQHYTPIFTSPHRENGVAVWIRSELVTSNKKGTWYAEAPQSSGLAFEITIGNQTHRIIAMYAQAKHHAEITPWLTTHLHKHPNTWVIGDLNTIITNADFRGVKRPQKWKELIQMIEQHQLTDVMAATNPTTRMTRTYGAPGQTRIDHILCTASTDMHGVTTDYPDLPRSDHIPIQLHIPAPCVPQPQPFKPNHKQWTPIHRQTFWDPFSKEWPAIDKPQPSPHFAYTEKLLQTCT